MVEGGCKTAIGKRLKQTGARWKHRRVEHMAFLRRLAVRRPMGRLLDDGGGIAARFRKLALKELQKTEAIFFLIFLLCLARIRIVSHIQIYTQYLIRGSLETILARIRLVGFPICDRL